MSEFTQLTPMVAKVITVCGAAGLVTMVAGACVGANSRVGTRLIVAGLGLALVFAGAIGLQVVKAFLAS